MNEAFWAGKSVLVTGGSGFIGRHLCDRLFRAGAVLTNIDLLPFPFPLTTQDEHIAVHDICGDIAYAPAIREAVEQAKPDVIFHLAATSQVGECFEYPVESTYVNAIGTLLLLDLCRDRDVKLVVSTSDKVYGQRDREDGRLDSERAFQFGFSEADAFRPRHPYEASKGAADLFCQAYAVAYNVNVGVLRCGNVYGPFDLNLQRLIPSVLMALTSGQRPQLRTKDPRALRDYLYVSDAVEAFVMMAEHLEKIPYGFFNVSAGQPHSVLRVLDAIYRLRPDWASLTADFYDEPGAAFESKFLKLDSIVFRGMTGWTPAVLFEEGLEKTIQWYEEYNGE